MITIGPDAGQAFSVETYRTANVGSIETAVIFGGTAAINADDPTSDARGPPHAQWRIGLVARQ